MHRLLIGNDIWGNEGMHELSNAWHWTMMASTLSFRKSRVTLGGLGRYQFSCSLPLLLFSSAQSPETLYRNLATKLIIGMPYKVRPWDKHSVCDCFISLCFSFVSCGFRKHIAQKGFALEALQCRDYSIDQPWPFTEHRDVRVCILPSCVACSFKIENNQLYLSFGVQDLATVDTIFLSKLPAVGDRASVSSSVLRWEPLQLIRFIKCISLEQSE